MQKPVSLRRPEVEVLVGGPAPAPAPREASTRLWLRSSVATQTQLSSHTGPEKLELNGSLSRI